MSILRIYFKKFLQTHNATFLNLIRYRILITQNHRELGGPFKAGRTVLISGVCHINVMIIIIYALENQVRFLVY